MRVRSTSTPLTTSSLHVFSRDSHGGNYADWGTVSWQACTYQETIADMLSYSRLGSGGGGTRKVFQPCYHQKCTCDSYVPTPQWVVTDIYGDQSFVSSTELLAAGLCRYVNSGDDMCHVLNWPRPLTDCLLEDALQYDVPQSSRFYNHWLAVKPTMQTRASLSVFLYELRDVTRMFHILPSKHFSLKNWRDVLKYGNSQHLNYNFGWKPFLKDVKNTFKAVRSFDERLAKYLSNVNRDMYRRWIDSPVSCSETVLYPTISPVWLHRVVREYEDVFASSFHYVYDSPYASDPSLRWRAWGDSLGLNMDPSTIWAVLPWSFVVDWFYDVQGLLASQENDWLHTWVKLLQACYSRKRAGSLTWGINTPSAIGGAVLPGIKIKFSHYSRSLGCPSFTTDSNLDADKIRLGASLLFART